MAFILDRRRGLPTQPLGIDWSHPVTRDLQRAWSAQHPRYEAVGGHGVSLNGATLRASDLGASLDFSTASAPVDLGIVRAVARPITMRVRMLAHAASLSNVSSVHMPATSGTGWRLDFNTTFGAVNFVPTYNGVANHPASSYSFSAFGPRAVMDYVAVMSATELNHYVQGLPSGTSAAVTFSNAAANSTIKVGNAGSVARILSVEYWGRLLSAAEIAHLYADPWCMYRQPAQPVFYPLAGGGDQTITVSDTAAGSDTITIGAALALADTGAGTDALSIAAALALADSGTGTDGTPSITVTVTLTDSATGTETLAGSASIALTDTGTGTDALSVLTATLISIADAATGTDAVSITVALALTDAGTGTEGLGGATSFALSDTGAGSDAVSLVSDTLRAVADVATGTDAVSITVQLTVPDTGAGLEALGITAALAVLDQGIGYDVVVNSAPGLAKVVSITFTARTRRIAFSATARTINFTMH